MRTQFSWRILCVHFRPCYVEFLRNGRNMEGVLTGSQYFDANSNVAIRFFFRNWYLYSQSVSRSAKMSRFWGSEDPLA